MYRESISHFPLINPTRYHPVINGVIIASQATAIPNALHIPISNELNTNTTHSRTEGAANAGQRRENHVEARHGVE